MADLFDKCKRFVEGSKIVSGEDRRFAAQLFSSISPAANAGPWMETDGRPLLQFGSNDYLGLATHPDVVAAAAEATRRYGIGAPMGSRMLTGNTAHHVALEAELARFKRCESAVVFCNGALAMMGSIACLAGPRDLVIMDEHAHATLVCGAKISGAEIVFFRHNDMAHLQHILHKAGGAKPAAIVVDGIYSMQGDMGPLDDLVELKRKYAARLIVDDAHGTGVFGEEGRGTAAHFGVEAEIDLHAGTFSKALGTIGGFVTGPAAVVEFIRYNAPTMVFTKAVPLAVVEATRASLALLQAGDDRRRRAWDNARRLQDGLRQQRFSIGDTQSPITPVEYPGNTALYVAYELRTAYGIWAAPVIYPAVPLGKSILRMIPTASHSESDIDYLISALADIRAAMAIGSLAMA